jgi:hypothetical protein
MSKLFTWFTGLFTMAVLMSGCALWKGKEELPKLPEPATNSTLSGAEKELDKATAERLSKAAAAVGMANILVDKEPPSKNQEVLKSEIKLAKTLVGKAEQPDWEAAQKRAQAALGGQPIADAYGKEQAEAVALRVKLQEADAKYEAEKARKQAEYESKLKEREQALAQEKELRRMEAEEARKDKFLYMGGLVCLAGVAMFIFGSKPMGLQLFAAGVAVSSMPFVWDNPYFIYIVGAFALLGLIAVARVVFRKKPTTCPAQPSEDKPAE